MFLVGILNWWYRDGWMSRIEMYKSRVYVLLDYFSIGQLIRTLFAPYRQISAAHNKGALSERFQAFLDRSISRLIGFFVRSIVVIIGVLAIIAQSVFALTVLIFWLIIPFLPAIGVILTIVSVEV